jgi:D-3-phosphoglycerate dehydrogenase
MTTLYRVLVSDPIAQEGVEVLRQSGICHVDVKTGLKPDEFNAIIGQYDALVVRSMTKVKEPAIALATRLKVIGRAGAGVDNVDVPAATAHGTLVMNTPAGNNLSVAELVIGHVFALARHIPQATASVKAGKWEKAKFMGQEVQGQILGILGLGAIGRIVAEKAHCLGLRVIGHDPLVTPEQAHSFGVQWVDFDHLMGGCNFLTVHVPLVSSTRGMVNAAALAKMRIGAYLIDAARGGIVVEKDLYEALTSGHLAGAALDVFEQEPTDKANPLLTLDNVICTPHLGASTVQAQDKVGVQIAHQIVQFLRDGTIINAVNQLN